MRFAFPSVHEFRLDTGLIVLAVPHHEQAGLVAALQIPVGRFSDPQGREGTAEITIALMQRATKSHCQESFAEKLEQTGSALYAEAEDEYLILSCRMLSRFAESILPLFWETVYAPALETSELARLKREMATTMQAELSDSHSLASKHFYAELFGREHPAGRNHSPRSVRRIQTGDVHDFYARHIRPEGSVLAIVGDFELDAYENRWANMFRHWRNTSGRPQSAVSRPQLRAPQRTSVRLIDKPDFSQTSLLIGHPAPPELHADRNALALANYILGGGNFSSRLMARIRTRIGKTYGISSQLVCTHHFGIFLIGTSTQSGQLGEVLDAILEVYRNLGQNGVTAEELAKAQQFAVGNLAFQLEGIGNITEKLLWLRHFNRPVSYIENFDAIISNISLCEVNAAINRHLSSQHFIIAAVGKKAQIERQLLRFGKVRSFPFRALP